MNSQVKTGRDKLGLTTGLNKRESRISNRNHSGSLTNRGIRKTGRGYTRQDWIAHHRKIVERSDHYEENSVGINKLEKLTEVLRTRQNKAEQKGEQMENHLDNATVTGVDSTGSATEEELMDELNVCMHKLKNLPNDRKVTKSNDTGTATPARTNCTDDLYVLAEVQVQEPNDLFKRKKQFQADDSNEVVQTDEGNNNEAMEVDIAEVDERHNDPSLAALLTQADREKAVTTVAIKKEVLDEVVMEGNSLFSDDTSAADNSRESESDNTNWEDSSSSDASMSDSDSSESTTKVHNSNKAAKKLQSTGTTVKRKSVMHESTNMQKKLHVTSLTYTDGNATEIISDTQSFGKVTKDHPMAVRDADGKRKGDSESIQDFMTENEMDEISGNNENDRTTTGNTGNSTERGSGSSSIGNADTNVAGTQIIGDMNQAFSTTSIRDETNQTLGRNEADAEDTVLNHQCVTNDNTHNDLTIDPTKIGYRGHNTGSTMNPSSVDKVDSDEEWRQIAVERKRLNSSTSKWDTKEHHTYTASRKKDNFKKLSTIRVVTSTKHTDELIQERGASMIDKRQLLHTPIRIEFNLDTSIGEFNIITAVTELFCTMFKRDNTMRILQTGQTTRLWEDKMNLPEDEDFIERFKLKEQTFRKGSKKITIHCVVESRLTINTMKHSEPIRTYIFDKNIWIKPDYYMAKTIGSPGFLTLMHPKLTNKIHLVQEIEETLSHLDIRTEEPAATEWHARNKTDVKTTPVPIPTFHVETNIKKWGDIQTEVITVQCSAEDAKYMKYLMVEASTQNKWKKGVFVPSGIHLLEGKEVMTHILEEQQRFVEQVIPFQLSGISKQEMYQQTMAGTTTYEILLAYDGVQSVEQTYLTDKRGQWIVVVDKLRKEGLKQYITEKLTDIYKNKRGEQQWLVTHQEAGFSQREGMQIVDSKRSQLRTYADVLRRRFAGGTVRSTHVSGSGAARSNSPAKSPEEDVPGLIPVRPTSQAKPPMDDTNRGPTSSRKVSTEATTYPDNGNEPRKEEASSATIVTDVTMEVSMTEEAVSVARTTPLKHKDFGNDSLLTIHQRYEEKLAQSEQTFQEKLFELENRQSKILQGYETRITDKIEKKLDKRLRTVSQEVADTVTMRMMQAMSGFFRKNRVDQNSDNIIAREVITQESPLKGTIQTPPDKQEQSMDRSMESTNRQIQNVSQPKTATPTITIPQLCVNDSPHDKPPLESSSEIIK